MAPAREHGKSPHDVPDRRRTAALDRVLRSKAYVFNILSPNGHKPIIIRGVYTYLKATPLPSVPALVGIEIMMSKYVFGTPFFVTFVDHFGTSDHHLCPPGSPRGG